MDLRQGPKISLLMQLQAVYGLIPGSAATWQFSPPVILSSDPDGRNTKIKLTPLVTNPTYTKPRTFRYNRCMLANLKRLFPVPAMLALDPAVTSTYGAFAYLLKTYGVLFDASDVEDLPITIDTDGAPLITLQSKDSSLLWRGSVVVKSGGLPHISKAINPAYFEWS